MSVKQLINSISIETLNVVISFLFVINLFLGGSILLWLAFFVMWEILLIKLIKKQKKEKNFLLYLFIIGFIGVFCLKIWFGIKLYHLITFSGI